MIVVINTQYKENYGTEDQPHWKFKGGTSYKIVGFPQDMSLEAVVQAVREPLEYHGDFTEEYIVSYSFEADDFLSQFERDQLEYDGEILYPEPQIRWPSKVDSLNAVCYSVETAKHMGATDELQRNY